jgi:predicted kinase
VVKSAVVIQGAPGVGKTTLARRIAKDLSIRLIVKDDIKECLYERLGFPKNRTESQLYGRIAIRTMYAGLEEFSTIGEQVIIEAPLIPNFACEELSAIISLDKLLQVHVSCDPEVNEVRFRSRIEKGDRHPGHADTAVDGVALQSKHKAIQGIDTIYVDTTNFTDDNYKLFIEDLKLKMGGDKT